MPMFAIFAVVLLVVPALTKKHSSGPSSATKATATFDALKRVDKGEQLYHGAHGRYTAHVADLVALSSPLAGDLATVKIALDVGTDGQTFLAQVSSDVLNLVHSRGTNTIGTSSCTVVKSGKGVACPKTPTTTPTG